ncbi:monovalent cation/H(+) antiporter subunit G [bacterium]|nr:monovalent cation/H(+) antiporter subunit G [bacterium]
MGELLNIVSIILILSGLVFFLGASIGILRFPDFYTRMHAAGKGDTLSTILIMSGMAIQVIGDFEGSSVLVAIKILAIAVLIMLTSPTSTHLLMKAGFDDGIIPVSKDKKTKINDLGGPFLEDSLSNESVAKKKTATRKRVKK